MKKKLLVLGLSLFLVGCSNNDDKVTEYSSSSKSYDSTSEDAVKIDYFNFTQDDIISATEKELKERIAEEKIFLQDNGIKVRVFENEDRTMKVLSYFKDDSSNPFAVLFSTPKNSNPRRENSLNILTQLKSDLSQESLSSIGFFDEDMEYNRHLTGYKILNSEETYSSYKDLSLDDFLSDEKRLNEIKEMVSKQEFKKMYDFTNDYIKNSNPDKSDFSYSLINMLEPNKDIFNNLVNDFDNIEKNTKVFYLKETPISLENNIKPYLGEDGSLNFDIGFQNDGWLFFNKYIISDGEDILMESNVKNTATNVFNGGTIEEIAKSQKAFDLSIPKLIEASDMTVRFKGKDSDLDKKLSSENVTAINNLARLHWLKRDLSNTIYSYENY